MLKWQEERPSPCGPAGWKPNLWPQPWQSSNIPTPARSSFSWVSPQAHCFPSSGPPLHKCSLLMFLVTAAEWVRELWWLWTCLSFPTNRNKEDKTICVCSARVWECENVKVRNSGSVFRYVSKWVVTYPAGFSHHWAAVGGCELISTQSCEQRSVRLEKETSEQVSKWVSKWDTVTDETYAAFAMFVVCVYVCELDRLITCVWIVWMYEVSVYCGRSLLHRPLTLHDPALMLCRCSVNNAWCMNCITDE